LKRKICVVVASRANYGRIKYLLISLKKIQSIELQIVVGASMMLDRFGKAVDILIKDGFTPIRSLYYVVEGETLATQAKSTGLGIMELSNVFEDLKPDMVVTVADRFETMATAIAASYLNIKLVHIQGGEISGNIDERVRHAITKLSDLHFPSTEESKNRLIKMGEDPKYIFNFGCPAMDILENENLNIDNKLISQYDGVGIKTDWERPYILLSQHPVTTSYGEGAEQISESLHALKEIKDIQKVILWPNIDAGSDDVAGGIRKFREVNMQENFQYFKNFPPGIYAKIIKNAVCVVGNSSSFIRECSFLGTPAVLVGDRQEGREHGANVIFSTHDRHDIIDKIRKQLAHKRYESDKIFGHGNAGDKIAEVLASIDINSIQKRNTY